MQTEQIDLITTMGTQLRPLAAIAMLLVASGFFSGSETVLFSLSPYQKLQLRRTSRLGKLVVRLLSRPEEILMTILLANMTINVAIFTISSTVMYNFYHQGRSGIATLTGLGTLIAVITLGEITPKALGFHLRMTLAPLVTVPLFALARVLRPVLWVLRTFLVNPITRLLVGPGVAPAQAVSRQDLGQLLENCQRHGLLDQPQQQMLERVLDLKDLTVRQVMVPRVQIKALKFSSSPDELRRFMQQTRLTKVPIYRQQIDDLLGIIHARRAFTEPDRPLSELIESVQYVPEQQPVDHLLNHFRQTNTKFAMVVDEYGGIAGLVSLEDVLEQIVGDIAGPQEDQSTEQIVWLDDRTCTVSGQMSVKQAVRKLSLPEPDVRVNTVGGLIMSLLGKMPSVGDRINYGPAELEVIEVHRRRVQKVKVHLAGKDEN